MAKKKNSNTSGLSVNVKQFLAAEASLARMERSQATIRDIAKEQEAILDKSVLHRDAMVQFGTKDQAQAAQGVKLAARVTQLTADQTKLMSLLVQAKIDGNKEAVKGLQIALKENQIKLKTESKLKEIHDRTKEITSEFDTWRDSLLKAVEISKTLITDWKVIGVVLGKAALDAGKEFKTWHKDLQMSGAQAFTFGTQIASAGASGLLMGVSLKATKAAAKALVTEMGSLGSVTTQMIQDSAYISDNFGVSADNAAKLTRMFKGAEAATGKTTAETTQMVKDMAETSNIPVGTLMSEMAENMDHFAKYSDGSVDNMAKMAKSALELGLSMSSVSKISDGLLDIETSMAAEMEASVMLGKQLDFSKARELAWQGKSAEAAKEVLGQMGGIAAFNKMNVYQREAAAAAAGLEVSDLQKALQAQESLNENVEQYGNWLGTVISKGTKYVSILQDGATWGVENAHNIAAMGGAMSNVLGWIGKTNIAEKARNVIMKARGVIMKALGKGGPLTKAGKPDMRFKANKLGGGGDKTKDLKTKATQKGAGKGLKDTAGGLKAMGNAKVLFGIANLALAAPVFVLSLAAIPFLTFMGLTPLAMLGPNLKGLAQGLTSMGKAAAGVLVMALAGPALALATLSLPFLLFMAIPGLGAAMQLNFSLLAAGLAAFGNPGTAIFVLIGIGLLAALGIAMIPFAFALSLVTPLVEAFGNIIIGVFSMLPPIITAVAEGIGGFFTTLGTLDPMQILLLAPALAALGFAGLSMLIGAPGFLAVGLGFMLLGAALTIISPLTGVINEFFTALSTVDTKNIAVIGLALLPLAAAGAYLLIGAPGLLLGGLALMVLAPALNLIGEAVQKIGDFNFIAMAVGLTGMGAAGLAMLVGAPGFLVMAVGITALAASLTLLLPLLPMIETLASIGGLNIGGEGEAKGGAKGGEGEENLVATKLDELIEITKKGNTIVMNGQKVGETSLAQQRTYR